MSVNVPIVQRKLAASALVVYDSLGGGIDTPNRQNVNDARLRNARLKINAQPTDALSVGLSAWLSRSDFGAPSVGNENDQSPIVVEEPLSTNYDAYGLKISYQFSAFSV